MFIYMLECQDNSYYTGQAKDLEKRMKDHGKKSKYTRAKGVKRLVYVEELPDKYAHKREAEIKRLERQQKDDLLTSPINQVAKFKHIIPS